MDRYSEPACALAAALAAVILSAVLLRACVAPPPRRDATPICPTVCMAALPRRRGVVFVLVLLCACGGDLSPGPDSCPTGQRVDTFLVPLPILPLVLYQHKACVYQGPVMDGQFPLAAPARAEEIAWRLRLGRQVALAQGKDLATWDALSEAQKVAALLPALRQIWPQVTEADILAGLRLAVQP